VIPWGIPGATRKLAPPPPLPPPIPPPQQHLTTNHPTTPRPQPTLRTHPRLLPPYEPTSPPPQLNPPSRTLIQSPTKPTTHTPLATPSFSNPQNNPPTQPPPPPPTHTKKKWTVWKFFLTFLVLPYVSSINSCFPPPRQVSLLPSGGRNTFFTSTTYWILRFHSPHFPGS